MVREWIKRGLPGLDHLLNYDKSWLSTDLKAGLSVAAVALPVAIAYAELIGVSPIIGLYSCILPMIAYALLGSSRQMIVGPDAATCAVIAAVVTPLALGDSQLQWQLSIMMTIMTGFWCLIASYFRFGAIADLLSRPILNGLLNGVALTIIIGQLGGILGIKLSSLYTMGGQHFLASLSSNHLYTILIALLTLLTVIVLKRIKPNWPGPLVALVLAAFIGEFTQVSSYGVELIGNISAALPIVNWPGFQINLLRELVMPALNLALVSFVSLMLTARSFALKNGYEVDANNEFRALGIINIVSGLSQGFAISGASSRTVVNDSSGGKSQLVSIIAALVIAITLFFYKELLRFIPITSLSAILIYAAWGLLDIKGIWALRKRDVGAFWLALLTFVSVVLLGIIPGIGLAVVVGLIQFLSTVFRPTEQLLGINQEGMIHSLDDSDVIKAIPGIMMYRFNSPLTYFNVSYFKRRVLNLVDRMHSEPRWVVIDAVSSFTHADISVLTGIDELRRELYKRNINLVLAGRRTELARWFSYVRSGGSDKDILLMPDLHLALKFIQSKEVAMELKQYQLDMALDLPLDDDLELEKS